MKFKYKNAIFWVKFLVVVGDDTGSVQGYEFSRGEIN